MACEAVTGTPAVVIGPPSLVVHRMLIGGRQSVIHVRTHAATSCRQHAENMATAQLSAALRRDLSDASGPSPPLPFLRSRSVIEDMVTGWLRGILGPSHGAALPVHFAHPVASRIGSPAASATSFGPSTGRLRDARLATSPRVPQHPRSRLSWPTAPPPRRLARALAGPSPAPSPNPRTVRLSASRLPSLTARRGSNLPSRAVGSS